jgi:hypothetical protein
MTDQVPADDVSERPRLSEWLWPSCRSEASARRAVLYAVFANVLKLSAMGGPLVALAIDDRAAALGLLRSVTGIDLAVTILVVILLLRESYAGALAGFFWALFNRAHFYAAFAGRDLALPAWHEVLLFHLVPLVMLVFHLHGVRGTQALRQIRPPVEPSPAEPPPDE